MKPFKYILILFVLLISIKVTGQNTSGTGIVKRAWNRFFSDSVVAKKHGFIINPLFYYTPETRFAFGISTVLYFRTKYDSVHHRPSVVHPFFGVTQNRQVFVESPFQLFFKQGKYYLFGEISAYHYPYFFFGVGNGIPHDYSELYTALYPSCTLSVLKKATPDLYLGFRIQVDNYHISKKVPGGLLDQNLVPGSNGGLNSGIGPMLLYDTRNNIFSTTNGSYIELATWLNSKYTLSDYTYGSYVLDARKFIPWHKKDVIALQSYSNFMTGNPPFYQMAMLGGTKRMRGYYEGRYRDKNYTSVQAEYRSKFFVKERFGFAIFAGTGLVFDNFKDIDFLYLKPSAGGGLRIRFDRQEKINFRIDVAFGYRTFYQYFVLSEAF